MREVDGLREPEKGGGQEWAGAVGLGGIEA